MSITDITLYIVIVLKVTFTRYLNSIKSWDFFFSDWAGLKKSLENVYNIVRLGGCIRSRPGKVTAPHLLKGMTMHGRYLNDFTFNND